MTSVDLSSVVLALYRAAMTPAQWPAALKTVGDFVGGCAAALEFIQLPNTMIDIATTHGYDAQALVSIVGFELEEMDPWWVCVEAEPHSDLHIGSKHLPAKQFQRSAFYNEGLRQVEADWRDVMALTVPVSDGSTAIFSVYRNGKEDDFGFREIERMRALKPHIVQSLEISSRFGGHEVQEALNGALQTARGDAVLFLDLRCAVVYANALAEEWLNASESVIYYNAGRIHLRAEEANRSFQKGLRRCLDLIKGRQVLHGETVVWYHGNVQYSACLTPYLKRPSAAKLPFGYRTPAVAVIIRQFRPDSEGIAARVAQAYALTPAETRVLESFIDGMSMQEICEASSITMNTLKSQCRAIYQKTGTTNQASLIRMSLTGFNT